MEKPNLKEGMLKIPTEVTSVRLVSFSFVPAVKKLPAESTVTTGEQERQPMRRSNENLGKQKEVATSQTMSGDGVFKAEFVHVGGDSDEGVPMDHRARLARETNLRQEAHSQLKLTADHMTHGQLTPSQITAPSENTAHLSVNISPALKLAVLETANDKHCSMDAHGRNTSFGSKVCPILLLNQAPDKRKTLISDCRATHFAELLETPASSRESVLSEDWFGPHILSSEGSPASLSRTISPCSSVRSGVFSPSVIRVKRHSLAPGSSLAWNLQPCLSPASSSPAPSPYSLSPRTGRSWQRPPPTHLTLLTAILRKGRLPVLSSVQQRAYSPCWPISAASLSSCSACNAAAKLALICPSVARSQSQTPMEVHRAARHMPMHGPESQPLRCLTPPPSPDSEATNFGPPAQLLSHSHEFGSRSSSTDSTLQRVPSPTQQCRVPSLSQQCRITSLTQQRTAYPVNSVTQQIPGASPVSPSDHVTTDTPALQNLPFSNKPDPTPPILSNPVLSSSFSRLRSLSPKCCSPTPCATGDCPAPSPVPKLTYSPVPRCDDTQSSPAPSPVPKLTCSPVPKLTYSPVPRCDETWSSPAPSPVPNFTCTPVPKLTYSPVPRCDETQSSPAPSPVPNLTCTPMPKLTYSPVPRCDDTQSSPAPSPVPNLTCTPVPKLTYSPVPRCDETRSSPAPSPVPNLTCTPVPKLTYSPVPRCDDTQSSPVPSPVPNLTCTPVPKLTYSPVPRCDDTQSSPAPSPVPKLTFAPVPRCSEVRCLSPPQNGMKMSSLSERPHPQPPTCRLSPAPSMLSSTPCASPRSLCVLSPLPDSYSSTPEHLGLSPSPATISRDFLTPSPSLSPSLSPSSSPVPKSSSDRAGRQRKYKIKSSYKALAAIPTNTLLLEQQTIDDEVEKEVRPLDDADVDCVTETHSEMCSPSQLRQQSEELYAAIDQVLQDPLPMRRSHSAPQSLVTLTDVDVEVSKRLTSLPRSAGRETKYATFHVQPSGSTERNMTKPGVIRPVAVIPKLTEEDDEEEDFPNPFRQQYLEEISEQQSQKFGSTPTGQIPELSEDQRDPGSPTFRKRDIPREDELVLLITEKEETHTPPVAEGSSKIGPTSFNPAQVKTEVRETHI